MIFEIRIYEHWLDNPGKETGSIKDIDLFADPSDQRAYYAFSLFRELVSDDGGLWSKKKFEEIDGSWGEVVVKKNDLDHFIDEVHKRSLGVDTLENLSGDDQRETCNAEKNKLQVLDDKKRYRLVAIES